VPLRIGHTFSLGIEVVPQIIASFLDRSAGSRVMLRQDSAVAIIESLLRGEVDAAFTSIAPVEPDVRVVPLFEEPMLLAVPVADPLATVIHPGGATLAAVLPLGVVNEALGESALRAYALGVEAQLRLGNAISPGHYDAGWHITGTCGVVGAAVAAAVLLGLDADQLRAATRAGHGAAARPRCRRSRR
jgi:DNA-binding transcriptional LysR family regulator